MIVAASLCGKVRIQSGSLNEVMKGEFLGFLSGYNCLGQLILLVEFYCWGFDKSNVSTKFQLKTFDLLN